MQFIDLKRQFELQKEGIQAGIEKVLEHGRFIMGPEVQELETRLAEYAGVNYAITCSSGTDALLMALMAWGIGPGDAVFTTPFTFFATAEVIAITGATPVFVDICPDTFNIDCSLLEKAVQNVIREGKLRPQVVIPVDLFGLPAEYDAVTAIAEKYGLYVLEDAAQGFGGRYKGKVAGSFGDIAATSFFPAKPLGCYGDGGAVFTDDERSAQMLQSIRNHGQGKDRYENIRLGMNGRLDTIQAAVLLEKLKIFDTEIMLRNTWAHKYNTLLTDCLTVPKFFEGRTSTWAQYSVLAADEKERTKILAALAKAGIPAMIYYPIPLHLQKAFAYLGYKPGDMPVAEETGCRIFSLPMHPYLLEEEIEHVASVIKSSI